VGQTYFYFPPYDFPNDDRELRRAIEMSPSLTWAHSFLGFSLLQPGHRDEGLKEILRARELDPLAPSIAKNVANWYYFNREYPAAFENVKKSFELGPPFALATEVRIYLKAGSVEDAERLLQGEKVSRSDDQFLIYCEAMIDVAAGKRNEAFAIIKQLEKQSGPDLRFASWIARIAAALNEKELALSWLERGFDQGAIVVFFKDEPLWDPIRIDPRFANLMKRMGFPA
jgi:tetratricopeptide (TPR) repeat protein